MEKTIMTSKKNKNMVKARQKIAQKSFAFTTLAGLLAACNSDSDTAVVNTTLTGAVVKGPLQGALVFADADGDGEQGPNETGFTTLADGSYTISSSNALATIVATTTEDTIDTSSGEVLSGITLKAPAGATVVTPATTILEAQPDIEPAQLAVALGIPTTAADGSAIDLTSFNPYAADADPAAALAAEKAAQQVMVTIKAVSAAAEGAGMTVDDAFELAMTSVAEVVSEVAETVDVSAAEAGTSEIVKLDFSDSAVMDTVSTNVQELVSVIAADDESITIDETAFSAVLETAVTAVVNVNAAIESITDTDLTSTESMGVFATLSDVASEIKAAAEAEVITPGAGAALVTFTDASAVTAAADAATATIVETAAAEAVAADDASSATGSDASAAIDAATAAATAAAAAEAEAAAAAAVSGGGGGGASAISAAEVFNIISETGASWDGGSMSAQNLDFTISSGILDITQDIQVYDADFTDNFSNSLVDITAQTIDKAGTTNVGALTITNVTPPAYGEAEDKEVTIVISESGTTGKITVGFNVDWSVSGSTYTFSSDDPTLDITYVERDNSSTTVQLNNDSANTRSIVNDTIYGGDAELSFNILTLISKLEATGSDTFADLETRFATAGTTLEVSVDTSNLSIYSLATEQINSVTATIDIVDVIA
jgi:hypothetical protein